MRFSKTLKITKAATTPLLRPVFLLLVGAVLVAARGM
jgi:hypothetical protein